MTETHSDSTQPASEKAIVGEAQAASPEQAPPKPPAAAETGAAVDPNASAQAEQPAKTAEPSEPAAGAAESSGEQPQAEASESTESEAGTASDASASASDATQPEAETAEAGSGDEAGSSAEAATEAGKEKKKRRRRRKKKPAEAGAAEAKPGQSAHAPFLRLFSGTSGRKHAFSVGEVIAGRVENTDDGAIVVDLFGKAKAVADINEPREIPVVEPEPQAEAKTSVEAEPSGAAGDQAAPAAAEAPAATAALTEEPATSSEPPSAEAGSPETSVTTEAIVVADPEAKPAFEATAPSGAEVAAAVDPHAETVSGAETPTTAEAQPPQAAEQHPEDAQGVDHWAFAESAERESDPPPPPGEDLSEADLSLLEPLPELEPPSVGGIFRGRIGSVAESGHIAIVNRVIDKAAVRKALRAARDQRQRVTGVVYGFNRGGFDVLVGGVRAFCPASGMSLTPIENPEEFIGKKCEFSLPQDKGGKRSIIVSRRNILEKEARKRARERMNELEVGMKLKGKVLEIRDYGVLVDLGGGLDGLVHLSEVSWNRGARPVDVVRIDDEVDVEVLKLQPASRKDRFGRVSLSIRKCLPDPWDAAQDILKPGSPVHGKIVRTTDFGAFVELREGIEGLLHISELSSGHKELTHAKQAVSEGDEIDVVVERVDKEQRRISLSKLSQADAEAVAAGELDPSKAPRSLKPGSHIAVVVKRVDHQGVQVQVEGVIGRRGRGFIPNRELQDQHGERRKGPSQGDVIEVKVIGTDRDGGLRCSVRARLLDEERRAVRDYRKESAKQGLGTFGDLLKAKLGGDSSD